MLKFGTKVKLKKNLFLGGLSGVIVDCYDAGEIVYRILLDDELARKYHDDLDLPESDLVVVEQKKKKKNDYYL
jgi:hypothetical protein